MLYFIVSQLHPLTWECLKICKLGTRNTSSLVILKITGREKLFLPFLGNCPLLPMTTVEQSRASPSVVVSLTVAMLPTTGRPKHLSRRMLKRLLLVAPAPSFRIPRQSGPFLYFHTPVWLAASISVDSACTGLLSKSLPQEVSNLTV